MRERVTGDMADMILDPLDPLDESSVSEFSASGSGADDTDDPLSGDSMDYDDWAGATSSAYLPSGSSRQRLRRRHGGRMGSQTQRPGWTSGNGPGYTDASLLDTLSALKEDVAKYLPNRPSFPAPPALYPPGDLLRSLPNRLRVLDTGVSYWLGQAPTADGGAGPSSPVVDSVASSPRHAAVDRARERVMQFVHAHLPSEEWAGWERLGWEEQDREWPSRRHSLDLGRGRVCRGSGDEADEEEEEPEYLFPNRTPLSAQGILAARRRGARSKSLGAASAPIGSTWADLMPQLTRTYTEPGHSPRTDFGSLADDDECGEEGREDQQGRTEILDIDGSAVGETKLKRVPSSQFLGPSLAETLAASEDGKKLVTFDQLPFQWRNNEHIITG